MGADEVRDVRDAACFLGCAWWGEEEVGEFADCWAGEDADWRHFEVVLSV